MRNTVLSKMGLSKGMWISCTAFKQRLQCVYDTLNIKQRATFTDVDKYYNYRYDYQLLNGEITRGFLIEGEITFKL